MKSKTSDSPEVVLTIGHSTRTLEDFIRLLKEYSVQMIVDVRTLPGSKRYPQFNRENLSPRLKAEGIDYVHMSGLGGLRRPRADSVNTGWRNSSFRGYADYMQTAEFEQNLQSLVAIAGQRRIALMCAEAVPWRCHRSLIADALAIRGIKVQHIISLTTARMHEVTPWARVNGTRITYPPEKQPGKRSSSRFGSALR